MLLLLLLWFIVAVVAVLVRSSIWIVFLYVTWIYSLRRVGVLWTTALTYVTQSNSIHHFVLTTCTERNILQRAAADSRPQVHFQMFIRSPWTFFFSDRQCEKGLSRRHEWSPIVPLRRSFSHVGIICGCSFKFLKRRHQTSAGRQLVERTPPPPLQMRWAGRASPICDTSESSSASSRKDSTWLQRLFNIYSQFSICSAKLRACVPLHLQLWCNILVVCQNVALQPTAQILHFFFWFKIIH